MGIHARSDSKSQDLRITEEQFQIPEYQQSIKDSIDTEKAAVDARLLTYLQKPVGERTEEMVHSTYERAFKERDSTLLDYFKSLELSEFQLKEVIKKLRYEFVAAGTRVFKHNAVGDKLYLIVEGLVSVWVP